MEDFEKWLSSFFCLLSQLCFDKAKELLDREKEIARPGLKPFFTQLTSFMEAEKSYLNLGFLSSKNKMFLRKETSLKSLYEMIRNEVHRLEENALNEAVDNSIATQFCQFLNARRDLIILYEQIYNSGVSSKHTKYEEIKNQVEICIEKYKCSFTNPTLLHIKNLFDWETDVLMNLLRAQIALQHWDMVQSTIHLHTAHSILNTWEKSLQSKEVQSDKKIGIIKKFLQTWKLGFLKGSQLPQLYQWLVKLKYAMVNKYTFYFYQTLSQQAAPQDTRNYLSTRFNTDLILKFQNLQKKCFATCVLLLFDPKGLPEWTGPGYHHPARPKETHDQHIIMNAHPYKMTEKLPIMTKILSERNASAMEPDKVVSFYDSQDKCSYFMCNIDPRVTLVVALEGKKEDRDSNLNIYMIDFCTQARFTRIFASLKISK
ncbi:KICSTOR complex protein C12orf66 homolog isoform X1 [Cimex lectularius]|uniref:Uncharacterized protein n=1 Tax=Cimex lectularius TaxID=79782 RepID=A0A8I6S8H1_CIMLE|nr:KICSTOR complex protein C12orf66 homolog isoform X1 [Cimex lectularius]